MAEERLLGPAEAPKPLLFSRQFSVEGTITGSLDDSARIAGAPPAAMLEAERAFATALKLDDDILTGDRLYIRWEQEFEELGHPVGIGRILSAELRTSRKGTVSISRFRPLKSPTNSPDSFYFADGRAAVPGPITLPLDQIQITSGFGLRPDPLDQPERTPPTVVHPPAVEAPLPAPVERKPEDVREIARAQAGLYDSQLGSARDAGGRPGGFSDVDRIMAERRIRAREEEARQKAEKEASQQQAAALPPAPPTPPPKPILVYMHEGLDLLGNFGVPVHAAADGTVTFARPDRGYGNAILIEHGNGLDTLYAHLSRFAADVGPGWQVRRGDVIGFVGSTGRSTGAHLHFEVLVRGKPVDPRTMLQPAQLTGFDLSRFRKKLAAEQKLRVEEKALEAGR